MIHLDGVTQHYGVRPVLRQIGLRINRGELVTVVGPNGMGKTTLLAVMAGILDPQEGEVEINGFRRRATVEEELAIRRQVVYLPDRPWLPKNRTGREYLLSVGRLYDIDFDRLFEHVERLLRLFCLTKEGDWPIRSYSNGQQKKIAICSALVTEAPVLLLDEPFAGGLDPAGIVALKRVLRRLVERSDATIVMTTPVPELVDELADRILILRDGAVAAFDTPEGIRRQTQSSGPIVDALDRLMHPQTLEDIERYFQELPQ
jgi:ABC-type multidrug transport system ATPase subunit